MGPVNPHTLESEPGRLDINLWSRFRSKTPTPPPPRVSPRGPLGGVAPLAGIHCPVSGKTDETEGDGGFAVSFLRQTCFLQETDQTTHIISTFFIQDPAGQSRFPPGPDPPVPLSPPKDRSGTRPRTDDVVGRTDRRGDMEPVRSTVRSHADGPPTPPRRDRGDERRAENPARPPSYLQALLMGRRRRGLDGGIVATARGVGRFTVLPLHP